MKKIAKTAGTKGQTSRLVAKRVRGAVVRTGVRGGLSGIGKEGDSFKGG